MACKTRFLLGIMLASLALAVTAANASSITGTEQINLTSYYIAIAPGKTASVGYNMSLVAGYYNSGTTLSIANAGGLLVYNISVILSNKFGNPPLSGTLYVMPSFSTPVGSYNVTIEGSNNNLVVIPAILRIYVGTKPNATTTALPKNVTTATTSTTLNTTTSTVASTTQTTSIAVLPPVQKSGGGAGIWVAIVVVIIIVAIAVLVYLRMKK